MLFLGTGSEEEAEKQGKQAPEERDRAGGRQKSRALLQLLLSPKTLKSQELEKSNSHTAKRLKPPKP